MDSDQGESTIPFNPAVGLQQRYMFLPAWFPRKAYISSIVLALATNTPNGLYNELAVWVDPGGQFFNGGTPHGAEEGACFTKAISLAHVAFTPTPGNNSQRWSFDFQYPILVDRDAGDLIEAKGGFNVEIVTVFLGIRFLVPNPHPLP